MFLQQYIATYVGIYVIYVKKKIFFKNNECLALNGSPGKFNTHKCPPLSISIGLYSSSPNTL